MEDKHLWQVIPHNHSRTFKFHLQSTAHTSQTGLEYKRGVAGSLTLKEIVTTGEKDGRSIKPTTNLQDPPPKP